MGMRIDGGDQTPQKKTNLREVQQRSEQNRTELKKIQLRDKLKKIRAQMKALEGKGNDDVAIRGFHFEYGDQTKLDTESMYKALEAQQYQILKDLEFVERKLEEQKMLNEIELRLEKEKKELQEQLKNKYGNKI